MEHSTDFYRGKMAMLKQLPQQVGINALTLALMSDVTDLCDRLDRQRTEMLGKFFVPVNPSIAADTAMSEQMNAEQSEQFTQILEDFQRENPLTALSVAECVAVHTEPEPVVESEPRVHSVRKGRPPNDPTAYHPRPCANPDCAEQVIRRGDEQSYNFKKRTTCSTECARLMQGMTRKAGTRSESAPSEPVVHSSEPIPIGVWQGNADSYVAHCMDNGNPIDPKVVQEITGLQTGTLRTFIQSAQIRHEATRATAKKATKGREADDE